MGVEMVSAESASRPRYGALAPLPGTRQVIVADDAGLAAAGRLIAAAPAGFAAAATLIATAPAAALPAAGRTVTVAGIDEAIAALQALLEQADMGTRLYIAGADPTLALVRRAGLAAGLSADAIAAEECGAPRRRVRCMHCATIVDDVTEPRITCPSCGLELAVRDHYSQRLAAYQGVWVGPGPVRITSAETAS